VYLPYLDEAAKARQPETGQHTLWPYFSRVLLSNCQAAFPLDPTTQASVLFRASSVPMWNCPAFTVGYPMAVTGRSIPVPRSSLGHASSRKTARGPNVCCAAAPDSAADILRLQR
jgi:hypothetical protein